MGISGPEYMVGTSNLGSENGHWKHPSCKENIGRNLILDSSSIWDLAYEVVRLVTFKSARIGWVLSLHQHFIVCAMKLFGTYDDRRFFGVNTWLVVTGTFLIFHFIYGMSSQPHWRTPSFFRGVAKNHQKLYIAQNTVPSWEDQFCKMQFFGPEILDRNIHMIHELRTFRCHPTAECWPQWTTIDLDIPRQKTNQSILPVLFSI